MEEKNKKSIINEALADYNAIKEAATEIANKKLAEEFPNKFNELLKEELNKNKPDKESYKKIDDEDKESKELDETEESKEKESDMKNQKEVEETVNITNTVGKGEPFEKKPKSVEEDVKITNTIGKTDPFTKKTKKEVEKIEEDREKDFAVDIETDTPNLEDGKNTKGIAFNNNIKANKNLKETFDISELDIDSVGNALENADENDEVITMDEIEDAISNLQNEEIEGMKDYPRPTNLNLGAPTGQGGDAYTKLINMRKELDEMIKTLNPESDDTNPEDDSQAPACPSAPIDEDDDEITDDDIKNALGIKEDEEIEEAHGISHSAGTISPSKLPQPEYLSTGEANRRRFSKFDESEKKINNLIEDNKKLTKKLNETKKLNTSTSELLEKYKTSLEKYRNHLNEMAIFNTNLANVNNLLVNENLALTQDDKIKIINEFKKVSSITESQKTYKSLLSEMKESKKAIVENFETKVSTSVQSSSKQILDEVIEKTAYSDNQHINKIKKIIDYVEHKNKK